MSARFTPGPWCWEQCGDKEDAPVVGIAWLSNDASCKPLSGRLKDYDADGEPIEFYRETVAYGIQSCDGCSASANASLIAAAPELYAALGRALDYLLFHCPELTDQSPLISDGREALAKARGEA